MTISTADRLAKVHARAFERVGKVQQTLLAERMQCLQDRRFCSVPGAQWEGELGEQFENRPRFEMNKVHLAVIRIFNEYRNNRIAVNFASRDGKKDKLADTVAGLFRADEQDSGAQEAYDNAFDEGASGGFGAIRVRTCYEDEEDEDDDSQRIRIEPITDADSCVYFDPDAKRQDKSDAKWCIVLTGKSIEAYKGEYGDDPTSWPKTVQNSYFDWYGPDLVYVGEYYEVEQKPETVYFYRGLALGSDEPNEVRLTEEELNEDGKREQLAATGFKLARSKTVKRTRVHKYIMSGGKVLEDCGLIAGRCLPIVPFYGKRWVVDGVERCMGHVRLAKDAQRLANMLRSWLAEMTARFDLEKPIFTPEQMTGHTTMWSQDNIEKYPYLLVNPITDANGQQMPAGPIAYTKAPSIPPAMAGLMQITEQDLQDLLGNQQAGEQLQANISAKAVELVQAKLDMQAYIYMDNFAKTKKRVAEVWWSMAQEVYVEDGREMKHVGPDDKTSRVELYKPTVDAETGETLLENDLVDAKIDITADVGPSSESKRTATVRTIAGMMQMTQDPDTMAVLTATAMMNIEGEGMDDLHGYFRKKLLALGAVQPTEEEAKELAQQQSQAQPDPNAEFLKASAVKALADAGQSQVKAQLLEAQIADTRADAISKLAAIQRDKEAHAVDLAIQLGQHGIDQQQAAQNAQQAQQQAAQVQNPQQ